MYQFTILLYLQIWLFFLSETLTLGQNFESPRTRYELISSDSNPNSQLLLIVNNDDNEENKLSVSLFKRDFHLSKEILILKMELDDKIITLDQLEIENTARSRLVTSTLSHKKTYSIFISANLSDENLLDIINSTNKTIRISSKQVNEEWIVNNDRLDDLLPRLKKKLPEKTEKAEDEILIVDLTSNDMSFYSVENGVLLKSIKSTHPFYNSGLEEGQIIIQINGVDIQNSSQFNSYFQSKRGTTSTFTIKTLSGDLKFIKINIP